MLTSEIREAERLTSRFQDDFAEGVRMLDAAMESFARMRSAAAAQGCSLYGLDVPVWDDDLRARARAHVAEHLDLDDRVLLDADHETFTDRLAARSAS